MADIDLIEKKLDCEEWREYAWVDEFGRRVHRFRVENPVALFLRPNGTTHRIQDAQGVIHCVPAPGQQGCVLSWKPRDPEKPVSF